MVSVGAAGWVGVVFWVVSVDALAAMVGSVSMSEAFGSWLDGWWSVPLTVGWMVLSVHLFWGLVA